MSCEGVAAALLCAVAGASALSGGWEAGVDARASAGQVDGAPVLSVVPALGVPRFSAVIELDVGLSPAEMVADDLNGDGRPDLATADVGSATVSVRFGDGTGNFRKRTAYRTARTPVGLTIADVEGDGDPDLVTASRNDAGSVSVLVNDGAGAFRRAGVYRSGFSSASAVTAADVTRDGIIDLVTTHVDEGQLTVLAGEPGGRFSVAQRYAGREATDVALGDLNGDGTLDAALASPTGVLLVRLGLAGGTFGPVHAYRSGSKSWGVDLADLNHDGRLDAAVANFGDSSVSVFLGAGDGNLAAPSRYPMGDRRDRWVDVPLVADFDRDGNPDIATPGQPAAVIRGRGDGTFLQREVVGSPYGFPTQSGAVADFDQDGWPDLAVSASCKWVDCFEYDPQWAYVYLNWTGRPAPPCVVPEIADRLRLRPAKRILRRAGCRLGQVRRRYSDCACKGRVIQQRPREYIVLASHAPVDVVVSRGRRS